MSTNKTLQPIKEYAVCHGRSERGYYCSRECELQRQRDAYGMGMYTIKDLLEQERQQRAEKTAQGAEA